MPITIEAGSDMASLCLFDPAALPPDFSQMPVRERSKVMDILATGAGSLRILTGGDGSFHVHVYVNESPPDNPGELVGKKSMVTQSGSFCLTGEEDVRPDDAQGFGQSAILIPPGNYSVKLWRAPQTEEAEAAALQKRAVTAVGQEAWSKYSRRSTYRVFVVIALMLSGAFCVLATLSRTGRNYFGWQGLVGIWLVWLALIQIVPRLMKSDQDETIAKILIEARKDIPSYIINLTRV